MEKSRAAVGQVYAFNTDTLQKSAMSTKEISKP